MQRGAALMKKGLAITFALFSSLLSSPSYATRILLTAYPNCPGFSANPKSSWSQYFSTEAKAGTGEGGKAEVQFTTFRKLNDPTAIGKLDPKTCYDVWYITKTKTYSGYAGGGPPTKQGLPGDPLQNEINVFGELFLFNDASGEIINKKGDIVGKLVCYFSFDECQGN
jgi:hypothetical protein